MSLANQGSTDLKCRAFFCLQYYRMYYMKTNDSRLPINGLECKNTGLSEEKFAALLQNFWQPLFHTWGQLRSPSWIPVFHGNLVLHQKFILLIVHPGYLPWDQNSMFSLGLSCFQAVGLTSLFILSWVFHFHFFFYCLFWLVSAVPCQPAMPHVIKSVFPSFFVGLLCILCVSAPVCQFYLLFLPFVSWIFDLFHLCSNKFYIVE